VENHSNNYYRPLSQMSTSLHDYVADGAEKEQDEEENKKEQNEEIKKYSVSIIHDFIGYDSACGESTDKASDHNRETHLHSGSMLKKEIESVEKIINELHESNKKTQQKIKTISCREENRSCQKDKTTLTHQLYFFLLITNLVHCLFAIRLFCGYFVDYIAMQSIPVQMLSRKCV